jgi:YebC/PmpR family DNA-binding regulatory protein
LRNAILAARGMNMPKDKIEAAVKRGSGPADTDNYEEMRYEGYGPNGVAIIVEALSDNRNRTASEVRAAFSKHGGALGETGSVGFLFDHVGVIIYPVAADTPDSMLEAAIEAGADDCYSDEEAHIIECAPDRLHAVRDALVGACGGEPESATLRWKSKTTTDIAGDAADKLEKLISSLEDSDDVQNVSGNFAFTDR